MNHTRVEKIMAAHAGLEGVRAGDEVSVRCDAAAFGEREADAILDRLDAGGGRIAPLLRLAVLPDVFFARSRTRPG
jgi:hypothetical protein